MRLLIITTLVLLLLITVAGCAARATDNPARPSAATTTTTTDAPSAPLSSNTDATPTPTPLTNVAAVASSTTTDEATSSSTSTAVAAADWPQWRGANRDGVVTGTPAPKTWPKELKEEWKTTVGVGHASPVAANGKVYVFARRGEEETLAALDPSTGKEIWKSGGHAAPYEMNPAARGHGKGPKSTPVVANGRVYTLGITGVLSAHDAENGRLVWRKEFSKQYPSTSPLYGTAMSPVVEKGLLIAHVGGHERGALTAFDTKTGAVKWSFEPDGPAYSSPVVATLAGTRQVITFTQKEFVSVSADTGELLWKLPAKTSYDTNCVTPLVYKDTVIFALEDGGVLAVRPTRQGARWTTPEVWRNRDHSLYMNTPVVHDRLLFGFSARNKGQLFALDADTGKTVWQGPGRAGENAALLNLAGTLLVLLDDATLLVQPAASTGYAPAARYTVADSPTWAHPLLLGDKILIKDETTLRALSLK